MPKPSGQLDENQAKDLIERRVDLRGQSWERRPFDRQILKNRAMYFGKQHFLQDERTGRLTDPQRVSPLKVFYKANLMLADMVRAMLTVTSARGEFVVPPKDGTRKQRHAAWVSEKLFEHVSFQNRISDKDRLATSFAAIDGSVVWKTSWDPKKGEPRRFYWSGNSRSSPVLVSPDEATRAQKEEAGEFDDLWTGFVDMEVVSLLQCQWDWAAREGGFDDASWAATLTLVTRERIEELYGPDVAKRAVPEDPSEGALYYNEAIAFMSSGYSSPLAPSWPDDTRKGERFLLAEYWERASPANGMVGRNIHYVGGVVAKNRDNPYRVTKHEIPLTKQDWITAPGRFVGISLAEQLTSPQVQYNSSRANVIEHQRVFGHPAIFVDPNSGIPTGQFSVMPGMVVAKKAGSAKVEFGPVPPTPEAALQNAEMSRGELAQISSQQSLDNSKMPGQLRSGDALDAIFAERNKLMVEPAENFLTAKAKVGQQALELMHKFGSDEQTIQYVGANHQFRVLSFKRADVHADLRVIIDRQKILASPTAAKARLMESLQFGVLDPTNPDDREAIHKALEFSTADELVTDRLQEEENQEEEIEAMTSDPARYLQGRADMMAPVEYEEGGQMKPPEEQQGFPINPWDDHRIHARVCVRFLRSPEFRQLDPLAQSLVIHHWEAHAAEVKAAQMEQLALEEALRGGAGEKGKPSQPKMQAAV